MRLIGLLSWYTENPAWLAACINGLAKQGVDHVIAVDGAYFLYPDGKNRSPSLEHQVITEACHANGMGLTIHTPADTWRGNEVEKRAFMFRLGLAVAEPHTDWFLVMDADSVITQPDPNLKTLLSETDLDAGEIMLYEHTRQDTPEALQFNVPPVHQQSIRSLFRALPGLTVKGNHYTYVAGDKVLWGQLGPDVVQPLNCLHVKMLHRNAHRSVSRNADRKAYYELRDTLGVEKSECVRCQTRKATRAVSVNPEPVGEASVSMSREMLCDVCAPKATKQTRRQLRDLGFDPDELTPEPKP